MLKHGILGLLNYSDMTGYEIKEIFEHSLNYFWTAQTSQIYRELQTLKKNNWAKCTLIEQQGKPHKKVFHITDEGKKELMNWLVFEDSGFTIRTPLLMKVFFMGELNIEESIAFFTNFKKQIEDYMWELQAADQYIDYFSQVVSDKKRTLFWELNLDYGKRNMKMHSEWADSCITKLKNCQSL